jgi:hypothetical protein
MKKEIFYSAPEVKVVQIHLEGSVLSGSVLKEGTASGEDITFGDVFDPWA